jgi:ATP-dependent protease ClpP protease subunit
MPSALRTFRLVFALAILLLATACDRHASSMPAKPPVPAPKVETEAMENGAISVAPITPGSPAGNTGKGKGRPAKTDWSPVALTSGQAWLSCELDYAGHGDGDRLLAMDRKTLDAALGACVDRGVLRLRYHGRIAADFATLVERVARVADQLKIAKRVLDLDSAGGQVEDAIRAGDVIAGSRWTIWVREDSICHSACVLLLSGGDVRHLAGKIGIHRIIRMSSTASTRAELNAELRVVYDRVRDYLERNGTSTAVADLMKAVPNRSLRLLTDDELLRFGLEGTNSAQDDLDRLRLQRECGVDFVARRDAFARAFDRQCGAVLKDLDDQNACGLALRARFGFPDTSCPAESPLSEFDLGQAEPEQPAKDTARAATAEGPDVQEPTAQAPTAQQPTEQKPTEQKPAAEAPDDPGAGH